MGALREDDRKELEKLFAELVKPVKLVMFTQEQGCQYCEATREILEEVAAISDKIALEVHDFAKEAELAAEYKVDKVPALIVMAEQDKGIRFYGVPAGYEFTSLIEVIVAVSLEIHGLPDAIVEELAKVDQPVRMEVLITPTWPHCPRAVRTAHQFALASEHITGEMVEVSEFPDLAMKYNVRGVPNTIINEKHSVLGAQPEGAFLKAVLEAVGK